MDASKVVGCASRVGVHYESVHGMSSETPQPQSSIKQHLSLSCQEQLRIALEIQRYNKVADIPCDFCFSNSC